MPLTRIISQHRYKFVVLFFLYLAQGLPLKFIGVAFPVLMRQHGTSLKYIGLLGLMTLPWSLKFLWAPYVDRWGRSSSFGHYKSWIFPLQIASAVTIVAMGAFDFGSQFFPIFILAMVFTVLAATQDIGADGLAIRLLSVRERPSGNTILLIGLLVGSLIGGGVLITLFNNIGWQSSLWIVALTLMVPLVFLAYLREPSPPQPTESQETPPVSFVSLWRTLKRPGMLAWLVLINLFFFGGALAAPMVRPLLVDLGLETAAIGIIVGVIDPIAGILGLLLAPFLMRNMDRSRALILFGYLHCLSMSLYLLVAAEWVGLPGIMAIYFFENLTSGFISVPLYAILMDNSDPETAGTDFTLQNSAIMLGRMVPLLVSGYLAEAIGYVGQLGIGVVLYVLGISVFLVYAKSRGTAHFTDSQRPSHTSE